MIRYEKYSCYFQCELSQKICQRYEQRSSDEFWQVISEMQYQYSSLIMPILIELIITWKKNIEQDWLNRIKKNQININSDEETIKWFDEKIR